MAEVMKLATNSAPVQVIDPGDMARRWDERPTAYGAALERQARERGMRAGWFSLHPQNRQEQHRTPDGWMAV